MVAIRGATTIVNDNKEEILLETKKLLEKIISTNNIKTENIISIIFTATDDLSKVYPAVAARELGITASGLICMQEMYVENSLKKCVRVLMMLESNSKQSEVVHVYLNDAKILRPDLTKKHKGVKNELPDCNWWTSWLR